MKAELQRSSIIIAVGATYGNKSNSKPNSEGVQHWL